MELPYVRHREQYIELVRELEEELKSATSGTETPGSMLHSIQQKLDDAAAKYQDDEKIGTARYKLYELQAFVHYFNHQDDKALDFINHSVDIRGSTYPKAEKLKDALALKGPRVSSKEVDESKLTKAEKRKKLIGLEGWLALFVVGQFLAFFVTAFRFFSNGSVSSSDISALNEYQAGLGDTLGTLTGLEDLMILAYVALIIATLVLLFRRHRLAKPFAIATLIFVAAYGAVDYAVASSVFNSSGLSQSAELQTILSKYAGDVGRNVIAAFVWVPYFLVSKRVKATLTK